MASIPWHEQDAFWEATARILFTSRRWALAPTELDQALGLMGLDPGATILDLCCGVGRHALLLRQGHHLIC